MDSIIQFLNSFASLIGSFFTWLADTLVSIIWGALYLIYDGFLTLIVAIVSAIDLSTLVTQTMASWGLLPDQLVYLINQVGVPQGLAILGYAYLIRMGLNLIPSVITRV